MSLSLCMRKRSSLSLLSRSLLSKRASSRVEYQKQRPSVHSEKLYVSISANNLHQHFRELEICSNTQSSLSPTPFHGRLCSTLAFTPTSIALTSVLSNFNVILPKEFPVPSTIRNEFLLPTRCKLLEKIDHVEHDAWEMPPQQDNYKKHAARLIVIRKRKMKKHKLQKLRKKMKFEWAKVRQRREMRKEKAFQAVLITQIKEAEKFDAAQYVADQLQKAHEIKIPRTWKGKRLPEFIIKQKLGIK